jgi:hypothetical protein
VRADLDDVPTLVFDEVDSGIGGEAGLAVGRRLANLAGDRQVLVVTHLPQIACFADRHILVEKGSGIASVRVLSDDERVRLRVKSSDDGAELRVAVDERIRLTAPFFPRWRKDLEQRYLRSFGLPPGRRVKALSRGTPTAAGIVMIGVTAAATTVVMARTVTDRPWVRLRMAAVPVVLCPSAVGCSDDGESGRLARPARHRRSTSDERAGARRAVDDRSRPRVDGSGGACSTYHGRLRWTVRRRWCGRRRDGSRLPLPLDGDRRRSRRRRGGR